MLSGTAEGRWDSLMRIAYVDAFSGASGDMLLGALVDAGVSLDELRRGLEGLSVTGYELRSDRVTRGGLAATKVHVELTDEQQPHRHLHHILSIIDESALPERVKERSRRVFRALAEAEAEVHGTSVESVHFHEVGAVDAIVDVVGTACCLELLEVEEVHCSPLVVGSGSVDAAHGRLPVPVPATAALIRGVPVRQVETGCELLTPTGSALLVTLATRFGPIPEMTIHLLGYGAGSRELPQHPNLLRVVVGETAETWSADQVAVLETNVDDASGEALGHLAGLLMERGALDVFFVPIQMKKQRPGVLLTVIARPEEADGLERIIFAHSGTFGIRRRLSGRHVLERTHETVQTEFGPVRVKVGRLGEQVTVVAPEYEDCAQRAGERGVAWRRVYEAALMAAHAQGIRPGDPAPSGEEVGRR